MRKIYLISFFLLTFSSFSSKRVDFEYLVQDEVPNFSQKSHSFTLPMIAGKIKNKEIDEASGMVFSTKKNGGIFVHNDSGGGSYVYVIDSLGNDLGIIALRGAINRDWEDIAIGPDAFSDESFVYLADIGDNYGDNHNIIIYRFSEPSAVMGQLSVSVETFILNYPDGPKDAETLIIDPLKRELFIVGKRGKENGIYKISLQEMEKGNKTLDKVGTLKISMIVGGDISRDGQQVLLKNYQQVFYWSRSNGESLEELFKRKPFELPYVPEPQGEAIAFHPSGNFYYTLSEKRLGIPPILYRYDKKK
jgi:hypothetical protein